MQGDAGVVGVNIIRYRLSVTFNRNDHAIIADYLGESFTGDPRLA